MKCPHCAKISKAKVLESRPFEGFTYRRRMCGGCLKTYVSREEAPAGLKMPEGTQSRHRITDRLPKPEERQGAPRGSGLHLQQLWR